MKTLIKRKMMSSSVARWIVLSVLGVCAAAYALTPADTVITNKAVVEYYDDVGNFFDSESNPAEVTVGEVYSATIEQDRLDYTGAPGQQVYIPYTLKNTGNATDTYSIGVATSTVTVATTGPLSTGYGGADLSGATVVIYPDDDGNGEPDTGAAAITSVDVDGETVQQVVVAVTVPGTADADDEIGVVLTATSGNTTVDDLTAGNGVDSSDTTVAGRVTVTTDAVLVLTKDSQVSGSTITYTLTVKNNGSTTATDVEIYDLMPFADVDGSGDLSTGDVKLVVSGSPSSAGLGNTGDTLGVSETDLTVAFLESSLGVDLNGDGILSTTAFNDLSDVGAAEEGASPVDEINAIYAVDASIAQNVEIEVTYSVTIPSSIAAGVDILNTFCVVADLDGGGAAGDTAQCSNETIDDTPQTYAVQVGDTTAGAFAGDNLGSSTYGTTDEDTTNDDNQTIDESSEGVSLNFYHVVSNNGNGPDSFLLSVAETGVDAQFPTGTTFEYYDSTGSILTADTTAVLQSGDTTVIKIIATLPTSIADNLTLGDDSVPLNAVVTNVAGLACVGLAATADGLGTCDGSQPFTTVLTATSVGGGISVNDTTGLELGLIAQSAPDLGNALTNNFAGTGVADGSFTTTNVSAAGDLHPDGGATDGTEEPYYIADDAYIPGDTVSFPMLVSNETGQSESFLLSADYLGFDPGAGFDEDNGDGGVESASAGALPDGWALSFTDTGGTPITSTSLLPAGGTFEYIAVVDISSSGAQAPVGDYDIRFVITASSTGETDSKVDRLVVNEDCQIELTEGQEDSVQAGGTVDFDHILRNNGNTTESIQLSSTFATAVDAGWSQTIQLELAGTYANLISAQSITVYNADGSASTTTLVGDDTDNAVVDGSDNGLLTVYLEPGEYINVRVRTFVPANASSGATEEITLSADPTQGSTVTSSCALITNTDTVEVIDQQVRISKSVAVDTDCNCMADDADFGEVGSGTVLPGQCVIWKLEAENQGSTTAFDVVIRDAMTDYSALAAAISVNGSSASSRETQLCVSGGLETSGCVSDADTGETDDVGSNHTYVVGTAANVDGANMFFPVGQIVADGGDPSVTDTDRTDGGTLVPGDTGAAMFCVEIQ